MPALMLSYGCGYAVVNPNVGGGRTVDVQIPENHTNWRSLEVNLAESLREDIQSLLNVRLNHRGADLILKSSIVDAFRSAPVRDRTGGALLGTSSLAVSWSLETRAGRLIAQGKIDQTLEFLPSADEDPYSALAEIIDWMAESIVIEINAGIAADDSSS